MNIIPFPKPGTGLSKGGSVLACELWIQVVRVTRLHWKVDHHKVIAPVSLVPPHVHQTQLASVDRFLLLQSGATETWLAESGYKRLNPFPHYSTSRNHSKPRYGGDKGT